MNIKLRNNIFIFFSLSYFNFLNYIFNSTETEKYKISKENLVYKDKEHIKGDFVFGVDNIYHNSLLKLLECINFQTDNKYVPSPGDRKTNKGMLDEYKYIDLSIMFLINKESEVVLKNAKFIIGTFKDQFLQDSKPSNYTNFRNLNSLRYEKDTFRENFIIYKMTYSFNYVDSKDIHYEIKKTYNEIKDIMEANKINDVNISYVINSANISQDFIEKHFDIFFTNLSVIVHGIKNEYYDLVDELQRIYKSLHGSEANIWNNEVFFTWINSSSYNFLSFLGIEDTSDEGLGKILTKIDLE